MIGQAHLQSRISQLIENRTFPRFSIFVGPKGSGKKTFVREVINDLTKGFFVETGIKVDDIRELISNSYKVQSTAVTTYFIPHADNMSNAAKNALLKVTEEPPNNAYFIMTLEDESNTLETIRSRGTVFYMDRYTPDEIFEYYWTIGEMPNDAELVREICETPGEVKKCVEMCQGTIQTFYDYVQLVVDNIAEVSTANAFKIPSKVALKDTDDGYDLRLFWKAFIKVCLEKAGGKGLTPEQILDYGEGVRVTDKYLQKLRINGINKQMLMDNWILEIRYLWQ